MFTELSRVPCYIIATEPKTVRAVPVGELEADAQAMGLDCVAVDDVAQALKVARDRTSENGLVCVTGAPRRKSKQTRAADAIRCPVSAETTGM